MLSAVGAPGRSSGTPPGKSLQELSSFAERGNIIVPCEEGDWCGSLPKLGWKSAIVSATTKETKKANLASLLAL